MRNRSSRRGSALLIVLGFLAFMVVSAVAFAIYMRTERLASSGFHRTVATRQLLKAGVARAVDAIESGVGDQPFPGLVRGDWPHRVYTPYPTNILATVPVLTLEALSYLPPALVNDVRAQARFTPTAAWSGLGYDAGRCAFVAVNVSDFFDVNKVRAGFGDSSSRPRNSSAKERVSLAYLYRSDDGKSYASGASASKLAVCDKFFEDRGGGTHNDVPFVSLADLNVALYAYDPSGDKTGILSPFYTYLANGGNADAFYSDGGDEQDDILRMARRELFVTDSWSSPTNQTTVCDLARGGQPFKQFYAGSVYPTILKAVGENLVQNSVDGRPAFQSAIKDDSTSHKAYSVDGGIGSVTFYSLLYDYLDNDSLPLSLSLPCTERVPMITALQPLLQGSSTPGIKLYVSTTTEKNAGKDENGAACDILHYWLSVKPPLMVNGYTMFPFKREGDLVDEAKNRFQVQVALRIFFVKSDVTTRVNVTGSSTLAVKEFLLASANNNCLTITPTTMAKVDLDKTFSQFTIQLTGGSSTFSKEILRCRTKSDGLATTVVKGSFEPQVCTIDGTDLCDKNGENGAEVLPCVAVWAKVVDMTHSKVVDMVPATVMDDMAQNGVNNAQFKVMFDPGTGYPMLYFLPKMSAFKFSLDNLSNLFGETGKAYDFTWGGLEAADPRYNWAPEDWVAESAEDYQKTYQRLGSSSDETPDVMKALLGQDGRDPDYWMFVSNQTNLQSVGELSFLPRLTGDATFFPFGSSRATAYTGVDLSKHNTAGSLADAADYMWRTYRLYDQDGEPQDHLFDRAVVSVGTGGLRVNPYSDIPLVREAAVADTPYDYWAAFIDNQTLKSKSFDQRLKYAFNPQGTFGDEAIMSRNDLTNLAARVFEKIRSAAATSRTVDNWENSFQNLDWYASGSPAKMFGYELKDSDDLDGVDRRTLFSFWHDSLGNDQQLYLVFVRVDPTSFGTGGADMIPSQLGGRAVALVWRSPQASSKTDAPHRTRLLFYHQLE